MNKFLKFKSGSDIRGTASEGVAFQNVDLTDDLVIKFSKAFAKFLNIKLNLKKLCVSVGHDSRISNTRLSNCVITGLKESGVDVIFTGLSSTPSMFMTTKDKKLNCDGAISITASHHPFNKNGLKFFTKDGGLESKDITEILNIAETEDFLTGNGSYKEVDFMTTYSNILVDFVRKATNEEKPLLNKKIIVDAGNGVGGFYVEKVLQPLGAITLGSQFLEPNGNFPNHIPNPENKEAMDSICAAVLKNKADFGIIFDTDVDRAGAVDCFGKEINRNKLIALISAILLEEQPNSYIVTDSVTSDGLSEFIKNHNGFHHRYKRGYKNVIDEGIKLNNEGKNCPLAIETSGHAALKENYFLDDGAYLITRLLISLANLNKKNIKLTNLIDDLKEPLEEAEIRMSFAENINFQLYGNKIIEDLTTFAKTNANLKIAECNYEGVRINFNKNNGNGWLLLRLSLHDPILPLNIESDTLGGTKIIAKQLLDFLQNYDSLILQNLKKFILGE